MTSGGVHLRRRGVVFCSMMCLTGVSLRHLLLTFCILNCRRGVVWMLLVTSGVFFVPNPRFGLFVKMFCVTVFCVWFLPLQVCLVLPMMSLFSTLRPVWHAAFCGKAFLRGSRHFATSMLFVFFVQLAPKRVHESSGWQRVVLGQTNSHVSPRCCCHFEHVPRVLRTPP